MQFTQRLLPSLVDEIAHVDPHRILYSIVKTNDPSNGFEDIDALSFARAVDCCSWYLDANLGKGHDFPTLAYMGPQDVMYAILILACIKTGYKLLLSSPRNTIDAHLSLLKEMKCNTFLLPPKFALPAVKEILAARQMRVLEVPGMHHWLANRLAQPYLYSKTFAQARLEPFVVLHTSGSTGMPKPIVLNNGTVSPMDAFTALPSFGQKPSYPAMCAGTRVYLAFPLFHCAGIAMALPGSIYSGFTIVLGPFPPSADIANAIHVHGNVQHSCLPPLTLIDLVQNPEYLNNLSRLEQVTFGGGPLPQFVGDMVIKKTKLLNCLGSTECGVLPVQLCDLEDWAYMSVSNTLGHEYRHVSEDLYEQVITRNPELDQYQGIFATFPGLIEWPMKDLYSKHPTKMDLWLYRGRADDIIVFSTGEKINPLEMESIIDTNPAVRTSLLSGFGRFQSSLLIEALKPPIIKSEKEALLDAIWPCVVEANQKSPSHGRVHRDMILFTSADKPMLRASKGTVQRKLTIELYSEELNALYEKPEFPTKEMYGSISNTNNFQDAIKNIIATCTDVDAAIIDPTADLFGLGVDSLQVTLITKKINEFLSTRGKNPWMEVGMVYSNPNVLALADVVRLLSGDKSCADNGQSDEEKMRSLYEIHSACLPITARQSQPKPHNDFAVLLTGSTGSLGSYILDALISDLRVSSIYCLNRGSDTAERQKQSQVSKGLQELSDKVICLDADISKPYLGLPLSEYRNLLRIVTLVIHNAWQVNFHMAVGSFSSHISTVARLIDFSAHSKFGAQLFFVSSISAVGNWRTITGHAEDVPEKVYEDWTIPNSMGYGQSKFVAERLLDKASRHCTVPTVICRVGQVAGPTTIVGMWPKHEWFPSLIKISKHLRKLPDTLGSAEVVDWIPVDSLARVIVELATKPVQENSGAGDATVYHVVNPRRTTWKELLPTIAQCLELGNTMQIVPFIDWLNSLRQVDTKTRDEEKGSAMRLLDFFGTLERGSAGGSVSLATKQTIRESQILGGMEAVNGEWIRNWMRQWEF